MQILWIVLSVLALNAGVLALMFFYFRRLISKTLSLDEILDRARTEVGQLLAELNQTTDRNVSLLEDRVERAREFVKAADKRFEALQRQGSERLREKELFDMLSRAKALVPREEVPHMPESREQASASAMNPPQQAPAASVQTLSESQKSQEISGQAFQAGAESGAANSEFGNSTPRIRKSEKNLDLGLSPAERVLRLWESGISSELIASRLSMTIAEVDLIIAMEEQRRLLRG